jgi:transposase
MTMTRKYRRYDPNQSFLLAPDIREWLPKEHLAFFINDTVDTLDLTEIYDYYEGSGRGAPPYEPSMLVKAITYGYCTGRPSSRKIEKGLVEDVGFRIIGAGNYPDFRTISDFRKIHLNSLSCLFAQVLKLCDEAGLVDLDVVAQDGSKFKANASLDQNRDYKTLCEEDERLIKKIKEDLRKAIELDELEDKKYGRDKRGDEPPEWMKDPKKRREWIRKAIGELDKEQRARREEYEEKLAERKAKEERSGTTLRGRKPKVVPAKPEDDVKANLTDPESRIMKTRSGYIQGYNAQAAVDSKHQIIVGTDVVQNRNDYHQLASMTGRIKKNMGRFPRAMVLDAGFSCEEEIRKVPAEIDLFIATNKDWKERKALREKPPPRGRIPSNMSPRDRMERKLLTKKGRKTYKIRGKTVEPIFGQIKTALGIDRFLLRGIEKAKGEWNLITMASNLLKLKRYGNKAPS